MFYRMFSGRVTSVCETCIQRKNIRATVWWVCISRNDDTKLLFRKEKGLTRFYIIISYHVWEANTSERESFASFHGITRISLREFEIFFIGPTTIRYALWNNNYLGCYILTFFYYHEIHNKNEFPILVDYTF